MITIPKSIQVSPSKKGEEFLNKKARKWIEEQGGDRSKEKLLHASDCLDPRYAYFSRLDPQPIPDRLVPIFLIGRVLHAFIICAVEGKAFDLAADGGSNVSEELGITYSPDMNFNGKVREIKTSRSFYEPEGAKDLSLYIEQLLIYLAGTNTTKGDLWVLYMNIKGGPQFRVYQVEISKSDLKKVQKEIKTITTLFHKVQKTGEFTKLPKCRAFKCSKKDCPYWERCKPEGRYGRPEATWKREEKEAESLGKATGTHLITVQEVQGRRVRKQEG